MPRLIARCFVREKVTSRRRNTPASVSFPKASHEAREAQAFPPAPSGNMWSGHSPAYCFLRHRSQGMPEGRSGRKLKYIIDAAGQSGQLRLVGISLFDGSGGQRRHYAVTSSVGMQSILGKISFEQTFLIYHRAEIIQIKVAMICAVTLQPAIQFHDFLR